jgi:hypothetical protein
MSNSNRAPPVIRQFKRFGRVIGDKHLRYTGSKRNVLGHFQAAVTPLRDLRRAPQSARNEQRFRGMLTCSGRA